MISVLCISFLCVLLYVFFYQFYIKEQGRQISAEKTYVFGFAAMLFLSMGVHLAAAVMYYGHETDMSCFMGWSDMVYSDGFKNFYASDSFTDYPPGYMYMLYIIGWLGSVAGQSALLVKLPAIALDLAAGVFVYLVAKKRFSEKGALALGAFALFSPVLILNASLWGQVDIVYTLLLAVFIWLVCKKRLIPGYYVFAASFFVKPQALIFTPILLFAFWDNVLKEFNSKKLIKHLMLGMGAVGMLVLLSLPFGLKETFNQYLITLDSYKYATINAFNLYGAFGLNWAPLTALTSALGFIFISGIVVFVLYEYVSGNKNWFFLAGVISFATYMLCTKMHERYAFPSVVFFLLAYAEKPQKISMKMFVLTTFSQLVNTAWVLFVYEQDINYYAGSAAVNILSAVNIAILVYMIFSCRKSRYEQEELMSEASAAGTGIFRTRWNIKLTKADVMLMLVLTLVYGALSFYDLGDGKAPETWHDLAQGPVTVDLGGSRYVEKIAVYPSCNDVNEERSIILSYTDENGVGDAIILDDQKVFAWNFTELGKNLTEITISTDHERLMIMETALFDENGLIDVESDNLMFDEQELVPERETYKNSAYFDEIYHARTGYEFVHGFNVYEWTHPPLGKVFISAGIKLFGMNPFGWRFAGNVFGILMVPLFYLMAKRLLRVTHIAFFTTVLFTFDFMHFVQTRIATIDVYVTFFIMLMYLFMYRYYQSSFYDTPLKKTFAPLLLTGVAFGLGAASKWTAIYACAGIALIYFMKMNERYSEYYKLGKEKLPFASGFIKSSIFCVVAFIVIPVLIYCVSYIPYLNTENTQGIKTIIDNQADIFVYHSETVLNSEHPYSSKWYTWPIMARPIWYYSGTASETVKEGISAFGNPAVWWGGAAAVLYNVYLAFAKGDRKARYLLIGYLACLLPWIPVERTTYIYHYFPCVPFATLMIGHSFERLYYRHVKAEKISLTVYAVIAVALFALFYPVLSGHGVEVEFAEKFLKWFDTWVLI